MKKRRKTSKRSLAKKKTLAKAKVMNYIRDYEAFYGPISKQRRAKILRDSLLK
jgi:hypothetical protein